MTAYHEATHAVAAHVVGIPTACVWVDERPARDIPRPGVGGRHDPDRRWIRAHKGLGDPAADDDNLFLKLAPGPAERRLALRRGWRDPGPDHFCSDFIEVVEALMVLVPPGSEHLSDAALDRLRVAEERARQLVADDASWRAIEAVAAALLEFIARGEFARLDGPRVHALIRAALGESEPSAAERWAIAAHERRLQNPAHRGHPRRKQP